MIHEAIILAGGFGTRLKNVVKDVPKPMAPINDKPFLEYLFKYLIKYNIQTVILSVGYKHEIISNYYSNSYYTLKLKYAIEDNPLGTGGGIVNALNYVNNNEVFIINGDTFFNVNLNDMCQFHKSNNSSITISLKEMKEFSRYGTVELIRNRIITFNEKKFMKAGYINGGIYIFKKNILLEPKKEMLQKFSFEKDFLEKNVNKLYISGYISDSYFIDIGIPEDYEKACIELPEFF